MKKTPAKSSPERVPNPAARELLKKCCAALLDKKAEDLLAFYVGPKSSVTDYLVVATGTSDPHRRALRIELERIMKENRARVLGVESSDESGWTVVDAFDVMVHLFSPEQRERYRLEKLWRDADEIDVAKLIEDKPAPKPRAKKAAKPSKPAKPSKSRKKA